MSRRYDRIPFVLYISSNNNWRFFSCSFLFDYSFAKNNQLQTFKSRYPPLLAFFPFSHLTFLLLANYTRDRLQKNNQPRARNGGRLPRLSRRRLRESRCAPRWFHARGTSAENQILAIALPNSFYKRAHYLSAALNCSNRISLFRLVYYLSSCFPTILCEHRSISSCLINELLRYQIKHLIGKIVYVYLLEIGFTDEL